MNEQNYRINQSESIAELATALSQAQAEIKPAKKSGFNPHFKAHFATLEDIFNAAQLVLPRFGLSLIQSTELIDGVTLLRTVLLHSSGQWIDGLYPVLCQKNDPQGLGSGMTYSRRYAAMAMLGLPAEDDDAEAATDRGGRIEKSGAEFVKKWNADKAPVEKLQPVRQTMGSENITEKQAKRLFAIAKKNNVSNEEVKGIIGKYGYEKTEQIQWEKYDEIISLIEARGFNPQDWEPAPEPA